MRRNGGRSTRRHLAWLLGASIATCIASSPGQAGAAVLLDFRYPHIIEFNFAPPPGAAPGFTYEVLPPTGGFVTFDFPLAPGTTVFDLTGDALAVTVDALTNGVVDGQFGFGFRFGDPLGGVVFREWVDFLPGRDTDLIGSTIDIVRLTLDLCLQPPGASSCFPTLDPDAFGFDVDIAFQVFGEPAQIMPTPGGLALFTLALIALAAARWRRRA